MQKAVAEPNKPSKTDALWHFAPFPGTWEPIEVFGGTFGVKKVLCDGVSSHRLLESWLWKSGTPASPTTMLGQPRAGGEDWPGEAEAANFWTIVVRVTPCSNDPSIFEGGQ